MQAPRKRKTVVPSVPLSSKHTSDTAAGASPPKKSRGTTHSLPPQSSSVLICAPTIVDRFWSVHFEGTALRFKEEGACREWAAAFEDVMVGLSKEEASEQWRALLVAVSEEEIARSKLEATPTSRRGAFQLLVECVRETADCNGECETHVCPGEAHERLVSSVHEPSHPFASRTVPCEDWWTCGLCRVCAVARYCQQERSVDKLERSVRAIEQRDAGREGAGRSITVEQVRRACRVIHAERCRLVVWSSRRGLRA